MPAQVLLRSNGLAELAVASDYASGLVDVNGKLACVTGDIDEIPEATASGTVIVKWVFNNCYTGASNQTVSGTLIREQSSEGGAFTMREYYDNLSIEAGGYTYHLNGNYESECTTLGDPTTCTGETVLKSGTEVFKFGSYNTYTWDTGAYAYRPQMVDGLYCDATAGCVTFGSASLGYPDSCGGRPSEGSINLAGASNSTAFLVANLGCTYSAGWTDANGNAGAADNVNWP